MLEELNRKLEACREHMRNKEKWTARVQLLEGRKKDLEHSLSMWREQLAQEEADVDRLMSISFSNLWYTLTGQKDKQLEKEQVEVLEAKVKADQAAAALADTERELEEARANGQAARFAEAEYRSLLLEKERTIQRSYPVLARELSELADRKADAAVRLKEWKEAYYEGMGALNALAAAAGSLESAKSWGTYDMLGGGYLSTRIKHDHMDDAVALVQEARRRLHRFRDELEDVKLAYAADTLDLSSLLRFSDYIFDGLLVDYAVQGRIKEALAQVSAQVDGLGDLIRRLGDEVRRCESEVAALDRQYSSLILTSGGK